MPARDAGAGRGTGAPRRAEPGTDGHRDAQDQDATKCEPDERDDLVVEDARCSLRRAGRQGVEVERADPVEGDAQQEHRRGDGQPGREHHPAPVPRDDDRNRQQSEPDHRQPRGEAVDEPEHLLHLVQVGGLEERERRVDLGDPVGDGEAGVDELGLDRVDDRRQADRHLSVLDGDRVTVAGERRHQLGVRLPVRPHPRVLEGV